MRANTPDGVRRARRLILLVAFAAVIGILIVHIGAGSTRIPPADVLRRLFEGPSGGDGADHFIVWSIRLPRALSCLVVGAILGLVGSAFQALFRNPLADPYIVGVSSGAAATGVFVLAMGLDGLAGGLMMPLACFAGGLASLYLVIGLARRRGFVDVTALLIAGAVTSSMLSALTSFVLLSSGKDSNQVLRWLLGSFNASFWNRTAIMAGVLAAGFWILILQSRRLNAFAVGEDAAGRLGVNVRRLKTTVLVTGTALVASTVGSVGIIGFLGLVAPHIARRLVGIDWRWSMAGATLVGAGLLLAADTLAQQISILSGELPVGIVTALLGAPFLLALMRRRTGL